MRFNAAEQSNDLLPGGVYEFEVVGASESISTNGNDMLVLKIKIEAKGLVITITDWIIAKQLKKLRKAAQSCGLGELFDSGEIPAESFMGRRGKAKIVVDRAANQNYRDRNIVEAYLGRR